MTVHRLHWLEKFVVQVAAAVTALAAYSVLWPLVEACDPEGPLTFFVGGQLQRLAWLAIGLWALAAVCGAATLISRPQGAMLALLVGMGALSVRSPGISPLLWTNMGQGWQLYTLLIVEIVVLTIVLLVADFIAANVRNVVGRVLPGWLWKPLPEEIAGSAEGQVQLRGRVLETVIIGAMIQLIGFIGQRRLKADDKKSRRKVMIQTGQFLLIAVVLAIALMLTIMRSCQRGQIIFALLGTFFLATLIAHQIAPTPLVAVTWCYPLNMAIIFYMLAAISTVGQPPQGWIHVSLFGRVLPIDWLTAGVGGAMMGGWVSNRMHDAKHITQADERAAETA